MQGNTDEPMEEEGLTIVVFASLLIIGFELFQTRLGPKPHLDIKLRILVN